MKHLRPWWGLLAAVALMMAALPVVGQVDEIEPNLYFHNVWAQATAVEGAAEGAAVDETEVYLTMANAGGIGVRLVGVESPIASSATLQESATSVDAPPASVEGGINVHAGEVVWLDPGTQHIALGGLTEPLLEGDAVPLTLTYVSLDEATGEPVGDPWTIQLAAPVMEEAPTPTEFVFSMVWARPADAGGTSAAYFNLLNAGGQDDTLIGASTDVAGLVEIHTMVMNGEVMEMRPVEGGVTVAPGDFASLAPGGIHVMMMDLPDALEEDTAFTLTLHFASGADIVLGVPVYDRTMQMSGM